MRDIEPFADTRHLAFCAQCGGPPETRDHVPPKTFFDKPFPPYLPVVGTCGACNGGASLDEEYVACLIEVAACGSANPDELERPRIVRALRRNTALASRFHAAFDSEAGVVTAELERVRRVIDKMARGLWAYELAEPALDRSADVRFQPLLTMGEDERARFERVHRSSLFAEVGSRMMTRQATATNAALAEDSAGWQIVQGNRFRYAIQIGDNDVIKLVLREYLAAEVQFESR